MLDLRAIDADWTLFLDRDGVINREKRDDYIRDAGEFEFLHGVPDALRALAAVFARIIVVTNQRGVGRGLMTQAQLDEIHARMTADIERAGGRIDATYWCTSTDPHHPDRKPNPGMAWQARRAMPAIDFARSVMVGNSMSDMAFGRNAGMHTVFVTSTHPDQALPHDDVDAAFDDLPAFVEALRAAR